jgi:hypothetical protein
MANRRRFVELLLDSEFKQNALRDLAMYLQNEIERVDKLIATPPEVSDDETSPKGPDGATPSKGLDSATSSKGPDRATDVVDRYREEKKILTMEENILYDLVNYLQKTGFLPTENKVLCERLSRTEAAHDVSD